MALTLNRDYQLKTGVIDHRSVIAHLKDVLNSFASKPNFSKFYIGITSDLEVRRAEHERKKPGFRQMCLIYEEDAPVVASSFHNLEKEAISAYRQGIRHPDSKQVLLSCENGPAGSSAKNFFYILVG